MISFLLNTDLCRNSISSSIFLFIGSLYYYLEYLNFLRSSGHHHHHAYRAKLELAASLHGLVVFDFVEIDSSFYGPPNPFMTKRWASITVDEVKKMFVSSQSYINSGHLLYINF